MSLKLYGILASQPVRAVYWVLKMNKIPFELVKTMPGKDTRNGEFKKMNIAGTVPVLQTESGFTLWESNAILVYLASQYKLFDLLPNPLEEPEKHALVQQWMNWHHLNTRRFTFITFAPLARPDLKLPPPSEKDVKVLQSVCNTIEKQLEKSPYLVGDSPTLADIVCYEDVGQCQEEYLGLFDFSKFPRVRKWAKDLESLEGFTETHKVLAKLKPFFAKSKM